MLAHIMFTKQKSTSQHYRAVGWGMCARPNQTSDVFHLNSLHFDNWDQGLTQKMEEKKNC